MITILIANIRQEKNISLRKLSSMTGISKSRLHRIENEKYLPDILEICKIAYALNVNERELYKFEP